MSDTTRSRYRAAIVAIAPIALLAAFLWHPYIPGRLPNEAAIAAAVAADPTRWGLVHVAAGLASGLVIIAFIAIRGYLREVGEVRWSGLGLPFIVIGSILYTLLPGMEFAPLAAVGAGADPEAAQAALQPWFLPVLVAGALTFALGTVGFSKAIADSGALSPTVTRGVVAALIVMAASRFVPFTAVQLYLQAVAAFVALWPLAFQMWNQPSELRPDAPAPRVPTV
jgi:hypothetical protein